jgi:hypothetical protein
MDQTGSINQADSRMEVIIGKWHLLHITADETNIPDHRMDLVFHSQVGGYRGAILSRANGKEIPLAAEHFDGTTLRLQMAAPGGKPQAEIPWLVMTLKNGRFEGCYQTSTGEPIERTGPQLKLVRAKNKIPSPRGVLLPNQKSRTGIR